MVDAIDVQVGPTNATDWIANRHTKDSCAKRRAAVFRHGQRKLGECTGVRAPRVLKSRVAAIRIVDQHDDIREHAYRNIDRDHQRAPEHRAQIHARRDKDQRRCIIYRRNVRVLAGAATRREPGPPTRSE